MHDFILLNLSYSQYLKFQRQAVTLYYGNNIQKQNIPSDIYNNKPSHCTVKCTVHAIMNSHYLLTLSLRITHSEGTVL